MRDAFGGVFMMRLMLVFIVLYVAFTAISFKYAKSFRIKNKVIDFVEQNQIIDIDTFFSQGSGNNMQELNSALRSANYTIHCNEVGYNDGKIVDRSTNKVIGYCYNGVVITKNTAKSTANTIYYNVYTYVDWNLGALNMILALGERDPNSEEPIFGKWKITGEAIVVNK